MNRPKRPHGLRLALTAWLCAVCAGACADTRGPQGGSEGEGPPPVWGYRVVNEYPHDPEGFTQGLAWAGGHLYEGTGLRGRSALSLRVLETGEALRTRTLDDRYFGEGVTVIGPRVLQLTWQSGVGFVYDRDTFEPLGSFTYSGEGWGLTHEGRRLILSDGTATLRFLDPDTFEETGRVQVRDDQGPVAQLNELEFVEGEVLANVWHTDRIARIDPATGRVVGWIDLAGLLEGTGDSTSPPDVLNGIAYDTEGRRLFVTGKLWPKLFEIELTPPSGD